MSVHLNNNQREIDFEKLIMDLKNTRYPLKTTLLSFYFIFKNKKQQLRYYGVDDPLKNDILLIVPEEVINIFVFI